MRIGITERGDAGIDFTWCDKINKMDMTILITKNITDRFLHKILECHNKNHKIILHATCTGWGNTLLEPNVPSYVNQLDQLRKLIDLGFPISQCVLRIDPIIPTTINGIEFPGIDFNDIKIDGIDQVNKVLLYAQFLNLTPAMRVRISVVDEYNHVKRRLTNMGYSTIYDGTRKYPNSTELARVKNLLNNWPTIQFETCAEPYLKNFNVEHTGCVSKKDLKIFGLTPDTDMLNPQNRTGCLCLGGKTELLENKKRCPHQCAYCYWCD